MKSAKAREDIVVISEQPYHPYSSTNY